MKNFHSSPRQNGCPAYASSAGKRGTASKECFNTIFLKFSLEPSIIALCGQRYSPKQAVICSGLLCKLQTDYRRRAKTRSLQQPINNARATFSSRPDSRRAWPASNALQPIIRNHGRPGA